MSARGRNVNGTVARLRSLSWCLTMAVCALLALAPAVQAQVTTGTLTGSVTVSTDNSALPGVTVEAVHVPTGTHYTAVTGSNGRYTIPNIRVGGPYTITAELSGFKPASVKNVQVALGTATEVGVPMQLATVSEAITVTATVDEIINPNKTGSTSSVSQQQIETLPTVNRTLQDFARTNPYFSTDPTQSNPYTLNVAGRNGRYNNIQIDGAVNNDLFGLAGSGTPGGQADAQPISLDAIQQLQLVVSPYDVRQSGFTGGGINAVTRSGTNKLEGSLFGTKRNKSYVGKGPFNSPVSDFNQTQWGGRVGGKIVTDKVFYFVSGEQNRQDRPLGSSADGSQGSNYIGSGTGNLPSASLLRDFVKTKYNLDVGSLGDLVYKTDSDLLLGKLDFNLGTGNALTLRHNYVDGISDRDPSSYSRYSNQFFFPTSNYGFKNITRSSVAQLNSVFSANSFNEARVGYQKIRDKRSTPVIFPTVEIGGSGERNGAITIGTERFSGANSLDQNILEVTDDFTWIKGAHTLVFGTHNEMFEFKNLFIADFYGYYYFPTLEAFEAGTPSIYKVGFATGANPRRPTQFKAAQYGLYANDSWRVNNQLTLSLGLRGNKPDFKTTPAYNDLVKTSIGYSTADKPRERITWEPRFGFNWDPSGAGRQQLRGGIGIFQGRAPFVWISNAYGGTGIEKVSLACTVAAKCAVPTFNPDPNSQPKNFAASGAVPAIDLVDPDFRFPSVLRGTLGYDRELFWGIRGTAEVLWSKSREDIFYFNVNKVQTGTSPLDGRPTYSTASTKLSDVTYLSNTNLGREVTETLQLNKNFRNLTLSASYAHQNAKSAGEGGSSTAYSGWQFEQYSSGDIFHPDLGISRWQVKHRFNLAGTYNFTTGPLTHGVGLYYNAQTGMPYSLLMGGDPNKDGSSNNDLLYIPAGGASGLILCPANAKTPTATAPCGAGVSPLDSSLFTNFLSSVGMDPNKAGVPERNNLTAPWLRRLDFHYELGLPQILGTRLLVQADVTNFGAMFDKKAGLVRGVSNSNWKPVNYVAIDSASGKPIYREATSGYLNPGRQFYTGTTASRWQGRLGLRLNF